MIDQTAINVLKGLVIDGVNNAGCGHPGGAMSSMDFAYLLFSEYLKLDPDDSKWLGRDRFVLSAGHESMLLYSLLHISDKLPLEELKNFRKLGSKTPGHPENFLTDGVECTTGPLGQGAAMSVGLALAQKHFADRLDTKLFDQNTWAILGDGCIQEDITLGAASLAGHLGLDNLIWYYDRNSVQISGEISRSISDDTKKVFEGFGFQVYECDGHSLEELRSTMDRAISFKGKPILIIGDTNIANGAFSMSGSAKTHGAPLPKEERLKTKENLDLPLEEDFYLPKNIKDHFQRNFSKRKAEVKEWKKHLDSLTSKDKSFEEEFKSLFINNSYSLKEYKWDISKDMATRNSFGHLLEYWCDAIPGLIGGSADLEPSNMTGWFAEKVGDIQKGSYKNRNIAYGVREFPMSAISNGLALFGGLIPFDATFLAFSDYSRAAIRLGAIQKVPVIHEFSHDSFYLGEDGPTHQPIEQVMSLRLMPDLMVIRPADSIETEILFSKAVHSENPSAFCLSRQKVPYLEIGREKTKECVRGAYEVTNIESPEMIILATGAEVHLALNVAKSLSNGSKIRVVSMPCWELFDQQSDSYKSKLIPLSCDKIISIEAGSTLGWHKYTGRNGLNIGIDTYGASGNAKDLEKKFGFTVPQIVQKIEQKYLNK